MINLTMSAFDTAEWWAGSGDGVRVTGWKESKRDFEAKIYVSFSRILPHICRKNVPQANIRAPICDSQQLPTAT